MFRYCCSTEYTQSVSNDACKVGEQKQHPNANKEAPHTLTICNMANEHNLLT